MHDLSGFNMARFIRFKSSHPDNLITQLLDYQVVAFFVLSVWVVFGQFVKFIL